uniref:Putative ubiquitin-conjugating enzyme n=1 Tax=Angomonas deanei TaxID=59799 RepID=C6K3K2_9TRYP|nr:putative ubiquitin-conjugating enzyme [Angomonas deanei]
MASRALKRAGMDFNRLQQSAESSATIQSVQIADESGNTKNGDLFHWRVEVNPPANSVYAGASYTLLFSLSPEQYPFKPPKVRVLTPIFNPMVSKEGGVCEALLENEEWKPTTPSPEFVEKVVVAVFTDFKKFDILNEEAANVMVNKSAEEFKREVVRVRATAKE